MGKQKNAASKISSKSKDMKDKKGGKRMSKKTAPAKGGMKKVADGDKRKIRFKPGTVALREIKRYQKTTNMMLPRASF